MTVTDVLALLPFITLATFAVIELLIIAFYRDHRLMMLLTLAGLALALVTLPLTATYRPRQITPLLVMDGYATFYTGLLLAATFVVIILSYGYMERYSGNREEFYVLILLATLGSAVLVASNHFASFFLGLEILSVALYVLIAYPYAQAQRIELGWGWQRWPYPYVQAQRIEAGIKYLILAGTTAAFLLFGMALLYAELGTMEFARMGLAEAFAGELPILLLTGLGLLTVGLGFKLALVPFHLWTPDVYQGAPAPVTAFVATVSKGGVFALMLRFFTQLDIHQHVALVGVFTIIAVMSMLAGNLLALLQDNVKRILAYSSIAHLGFLVMPFLASGELAQPAVAFYLVVYFATTLTAFGIVTLLSNPEKEAEELSDYRGLFWRRPWLALVFTAALLSLAGIPPTAGLVGKIFIAAAGIESSLWLLVIVLVVASVIGVFYYLRVVLTMYRRPAEEEPAAAIPSFTTAVGVTLALLTLLLVGLGVYPVPVMEIIERVVTRLA